MCGSNDEQTLFQGPDLLLQDESEQFRLATCQRCGNIYQNPRPTPETMGRYYPENYVPFLKAIEDEPSPWQRFNRSVGRRRRCMAVHQAAGKPGRILDIGCATGIFLDGMRTLGWQAEGVEPTASAAHYAQQRFGLPVFEGLLEDAHFPDASFDAVTMWDVFEHVHDPQLTMAEIRRILKPGGMLVLSLPNPDSLEAWLFGKHWIGWDLPRHLNLFRPTLLRQHLANADMPVEQIRSFTAGYSVLVMSIEQKLRALGHNPALLCKLLQSPPMRLLAMPYYAGPANWYNLSSIMVVFARRVERESHG